MAARWRSLLVLGLACTLFACSEPNPDSSTGQAGAQPTLEVGRLLGGSEADVGFARALPPARLEFPQDHGPHPDFRSEWWYLTLMLHDAQGEEYGGQFTLFRQAQSPGPLVPTNPWRSSHLYMAHLAMSDVAQQRHYSDERFARGHPGLAGARAADGVVGYRAWLDGWELRSIGAEFLPLMLDAHSEEFGWNLELQSSARGVKPIVLQGERGLSAKGPGQASFYYSFTRLEVTGSLSLHGQRVPVTGTAWLDQEWSTSVLSAGQEGWDWFAVQLDDGRDLMVFRLRREDGQRDVYDHGVLVQANGRYRSLDAAEFRLLPVRYWRDETGICWPVGWTLQLLDQDAEQARVLEEFTLQARIDDQRMTTAVRYWEGLASVAQGGEKVGRGYMELTGYQPVASACPQGSELD